MDEMNIKPPQRKYVSIFRIDGEPIIPPLMTSEKIRQMQKYKEKALKIEQRLKEQKLQQTTKKTTYADNLSETPPPSSLSTTLPGDGGLSSHRSQDSYDRRLKESEESMMMLKDIIRRQSEQYEYNATENDDKLKKLQKSETLIYDNSTNEVIKQLPYDEEAKMIHHAKANQEKNLKEIREDVNVTYTLHKKPYHLELCGLNDTAKAIPSICINPPTPLMGNRSICEPLSANTKRDGFFVTETKHIRQPLSDDSSSDESFNSMYTHSEKKVPPPVPERTYKLPRSSKMHDLKSYNTTTTNVSAKIQQYEAIHNEQSTPRVTPNSSPKKNNHESSILGTPSAVMSRSATSPSIKLGSSVTRPRTANECSQISPDNTLVRSSSFTLEGPSKALIDHMRQQRSVSDRNSSNGKNKTPSPPVVVKKAPTPPSRLHRDTVESKAKRVQKVELKPTRQKIQQKSSQHKLAQAAAASISPYKSKSSPFPKHGSTANLYKTKKSPYDTPNSTRISPTTPLSGKSTSQTRKSPPLPSASSSASSQRTISKSKSKTSLQSNKDNSMQDAQSEKEILTQMDKMQKEKFLRLLKQQEEEQRKLKESFEMQQKLLIEKLNKEMTSVHVTTTPKQSTSMNFNDTSSRISPEEDTQDTLNLSHDNSSILPLNLSHEKNTSVYPQVPPLAISNLSSMDHSNANTSMESTFSTRYGDGTSIDQTTFRTESMAEDDDLLTPIENRYTQSNNANSSSRRRLFPQEHMMNTPTTAIDSTTRPLTIHSPGNNQHLQQSLHQQQTKNATKGFISTVPATSVNSKRDDIHQMNILHAAATTINAYARGFLVRRLFKTEQIQRIVQTIHDTLIFVLNLHLETCENPNEANNPTNIKLKARLLQQLSSATQTLHLVLFQTSIKERMEIIAQDRKRIKHKLLMTMSRNSSARKTPRIPV
uniref:IQ calmodulin-binding motif protein n=1 Tax=Musca domestica TaxID=7370 RepID=A0A1I8N115_MUSDO